MKTWKQRVPFGMAAIIAIIFMFVACPEDGKSPPDDNNNGNNGGQNPSGNGNGNGGYDQSGAWHKLADPNVCGGGCMTEFITMRGEIRANAYADYNLSSSHVIHVEDACDSAAWNSWYANGGNYHNAPSFTIIGTNNRKVTYSADIDGNKKAPCFSVEDRTNAQNAATATASSCQDDQDIELGRK
jgi:hypothetical protein